MRIILLGPPGSGKGTQGDLIEDKYGFPKISTGDLLRDAIRRQTQLGYRAQSFMERGELVSDEIVIGIVRERISREDCRKGYILDGFPRNISQARRLEKIDNERPQIVIDIRVEDDVLLSRLTSRRICSRCGAVTNLNLPDRSAENCGQCGGTLTQRVDDKEDVITERLRVYHKMTEPLIDFYRKKTGYHALDGNRSIGAVAGDIDRILKDEGIFPKPEKGEE